MAGKGSEVILGIESRSKCIICEWYNICRLINVQIRAHYELSTSNYTWPDQSPDYIFFSQTNKSTNLNWKFLLLEMIPSDLYAKIQKEKIDKGDNVYMNLETFEHLRNNGELPSTLNIEKEGTYSLGMIILKLGLRRNIQELYDNQIQLPSKIMFFGIEVLDLDWKCWCSGKRDIEECIWGLDYDISRLSAKEYLVID